MKKNMGNLDRIIRLVLGLGAFAAGYIFNSWWGILGVIPVVTAFISWCPIYLPFGLSTCAKKEAKAEV